MFEILKETLATILATIGDLCTESSKALTKEDEVAKAMRKIDKLL